MGKKQRDLQDGTPYGPYKWMQIPNVIPMCNYVFPQTVCSTLGVLTVWVKGRVLDRRLRTGLRGILVVSSTSSMCIFPGNSRTFGLAVGGLGSS